MIQTDNLTPAVIVANLDSLLAELESNQTLRATRSLRELADRPYQHERYCCFGVACKQAGLTMPKSRSGFSVNGETYHAIPPAEIKQALGLEWQTEIGSMHYMLNGEIGVTDSTPSDGPNNVVSGTLMGFNDGLETGKHWESGFVINRLKLLRDYWQAKID